MNTPKKVLAAWKARRRLQRLADTLERGLGQG